MPAAITLAQKRRLERAARAAARASYSPYSKFRVGSAILTASGRVYSGCNVENASYGLTMCAERAAVAAAVASGRRAFRAVAVVAKGPRAPYPCGACRQVLAEFCGPDTPVLVARTGRRGVERLRVGELLPRAFALRTAGGRVRGKNVR